MDDLLCLEFYVLPTSEDMFIWVLDTFVKSSGHFPVSYIVLVFLFLCILISFINSDNIPLNSATFLVYRCVMLK